MPTEAKNGLGPEIRKLATDADPSSPVKMDAAVRKIALFCVENGVSFGEAMEEAYGQDNGAEQLEAENAKLREEVERRKQGGDLLAETLEQAKQRIATLEEQCQQRQQESPLWSVRKVLLILTAVIAARIILFVAMGEGPSLDGQTQTSPGFVPWLANMLLVLSGAWLLSQWHRAQHFESGWGQLVMKWVLLGPGLFLAASVFFGGPPWDASMYHREPLPALFVAVLTILLLLSKLTERIAERVPDAFATFSLRRAISWVIGWFF
jgi:hypothetical protein